MEKAADYCSAFGQRPEAAGQEAEKRMVARAAAGRSHASALGQEAPSAPCEVPKGHHVLTDGDWGKITQSLSLSGREVEIVQRIFDSEQELAIAEALGISCHTVHTHIGRLYRKLHVSSRCELVVRVFGQYVLLSSARRDRIAR